MNVSKKSMSVFAVMFLCCACKKEKLSTEYGDIYSTWVWTHTIKNEDDPFAEEEITPSSTGDIYKIKIEEKYMYFYKNNKQLFKRRYKEITYNPDVAGGTFVSIFITFNKKDYTAIGYDPSLMKMTFAYYPYNYVIIGDMDEPLADGNTYHNHFVKE